MTKCFKTKKEEKDKYTDSEFLSKQILFKSDEEESS